MNNANCLGEDTVLALIEGGLAPAEKAAVDEHVAACASCSRLVVALSQKEREEQEPAVEDGARVGRYQVFGPLGAGGMGVVYAARDPDLDRPVAIKLLRQDSLAQGEASMRVLREAQAMARLSHPNVVSVYDVGTFRDRVFIAMELVEGETLRSWLASGRRAPREILAVFAQAARGLGAAHDAGLVHRDFKPDNVLIEKAPGGWRTRVTDFGLARQFTDGVSISAEHAALSQRPTPPQGSTRTPAGALLGTPAYMSPEQFDGQPALAACDVFSFCVALWEALYGARPFMGGSTEEMRASIQRGPPRPPASPRVPGGVKRILATGLRVEARERPPSMEAIVRVLETDPRAWMWRAGAAAAVVLAVAAGALLLTRNRTCAGADVYLQAAWGVAQRDGLKQAFAARAQPWAQEAFAAASAALDRYAGDWVQMRTQACEATRLRRDQSERVLELREACLDRRLREMKGVVQILTAGDESLQRNAVKAATSISSLSRCADVEALTAPMPPGDPAQHAKVEEVRGRLADVRAVLAAGRPSDADAKSAALVGEARALHYAPLEAEALETRGEVLVATDKLAPGVQMLDDAIDAAEAGRDQKLAAMAWTVSVLAQLHQGQNDQAMASARHARSILSGIGGDPEIEARVEDYEGGLFLQTGRYAEAEERFRKLRDIYLSLYGGEDARYGRAIANIGVSFSRRHELAAALPFQTSANAIYEKALGPHHPLVAIGLLNEAGILAQLERTAEARPVAKRAFELAESNGPESSTVAQAETILGLLAQLDKNWPEAEQHFRRALALNNKIRGPGSLAAAVSEDKLGEVLESEGRHAESAAAFRNAAASLDKLGDKTMHADAMMGLSLALLGTGDKTQARAIAEDILQQMEAGADEIHKADARLTLARALPARDVDHARQLANAALATYRTSGKEGASRVTEAEDLLHQLQAR